MPVEVRSERLAAGPAIRGPALGRHVYPVEEDVVDFGHLERHMVEPCVDLVNLDQEQRVVI